MVSRWTGAVHLDFFLFLFLICWQITRVCLPEDPSCISRSTSKTWTMICWHITSCFPNFLATTLAWTNCAYMVTSHAYCDFKNIRFYVKRFDVNSCTLYLSVLFRSSDWRTPTKTLFYKENVKLKIFIQDWIHALVISFRPFLFILSYSIISLGP